MCLPVKPFKVEREWEFAGLKCAVVQAREGGHRCGYVRVPPGHAAHGKPYDDVDVQVHGGLTFGDAEPCEHEDGQGYWFGFDCAHHMDASFEAVFNENWSDNTKRVWKMYGDHKSPFLREHEHYWLQTEVEKETEQLAQQLAAMVPA